MTTEEQIQTLIKSQGGAENAIAYLLAYIEMRELQLDRVTVHHITPVSKLIKELRPSSNTNN